MTGLFITLLMLVLVVVAWRYAAGRKAPAAMTTRPKRLLSFTTATPAREALETIVAKTRNSAYSVESIDEAQRHLILSTPPTATTWGFFYPVYLTEQADGRTLVEVGIQSKLFQMGPLVRRQHAHCLAYLKEALASADDAA